MGQVVVADSLFGQLQTRDRQFGRCVKCLLSVFRSSFSQCIQADEMPARFRMRMSQIDRMTELFIRLCNISDARKAERPMITESRMYGVQRTGMTVAGFRLCIESTGEQRVGQVVPVQCDFRSDDGKRLLNLRSCISRIACQIRLRKFEGLLPGNINQMTTASPMAESGINRCRNCLIASPPDFPKSPLHHVRCCTAGISEGFRPRCPVGCRR